MKKLFEYITEAASSNVSGNDNKAFFKLFKQSTRFGKSGEDWYEAFDKMVEQFNLTLLDERKLEKTTNQAILTLLLSKKKEHCVLDVAVTRPAKKPDKYNEIEGGGTINLGADTLRSLSSCSDYEKWYKGYRGITKLQFAFPYGFFDNVRTNLWNKLI